MSIRVIIADDHPVVRAGLRLTLERSEGEIVIVGEAADGRAVLELAKQKFADVFIIDITMPNLNGLVAADELRQRYPAAKVIILSLHDTQVMVEAAFAAGAQGYLTKEMATQSVVEAVTAVHAGHYYLCPSVTHFVVAHRPQVGPRGARLREAVRPALTRQEKKILQLIAEGHSTKEIAVLLDRSANTIHVQRNSVMAKLGIHKQAALIRFALKTGLAKL